MQAFGRFWPNLTIILLLIAINAGFLVWGWSGDFEISGESGPIENTQVLILCVAFATYALQISKHEGVARNLAIALSFVCFFIALKEMDFRELRPASPGGRAYWVENTIPELIRKFMKYGSWAVFIVFLICRYREIPDMVRAVISWSAWPYFLCLGLLLMSQALEHGGFRNPQGLEGNALREALNEFHRSRIIAELWEELVELNAYLVLLYAGWTSAVISSLGSGKEV